MNKVNVFNIIIMFIVLAILSMLAFKLFGVKTGLEPFTFCDPTDCACVCDRNMYKPYCNSQYLKDGPEALCKCQWNEQTRKCLGKTIPGVKKGEIPTGYYMTY